MTRRAATYFVVGALLSFFLYMGMLAYLSRGF